MSTSENECGQATAPQVLREQIMDCRVPKNEREWWAAHHIEKIEAELDAERAAREKTEAERNEANITIYNLGLAIAKAGNELTSLRAELEAAKRDAERYRWLRSNPNFMGWEHDFLADQVDAAIDAAIAGKEK